MPNKKFYKKCGDRHVPPTGRNCVRSLSPERQMAVSPVSATSTEASLSTAAEVSTGEQSVALQQEISKQLQHVNARLETVEHDMETVKGAAHKQTDKISNSKSKLSVSDLSVSDSESSSDDSLIPDLSVLKSKKSRLIKG